MERRLCLVLFLFLFSLVFLSNSYQVNAIDISNCANLNQAGATYNLTTNIGNSLSLRCMNITANDIVLDCRGRTIDGSDNPPSEGIRIYATNQNITIKNCIVTDWYYGIYLQNANNNTLINNTVNSNVGTGIVLYPSSNSILTNNTANSNGGGGIAIGSSSTNNILTNNTVNSNTNAGISIYESSKNTILTNNTVKSNTNGIYMYSSSNSNILIKNTVTNNNNAGIYLDSNSYNNTMTNNIMNSNKYGIYLNSISDNSIRGGSISASTASDYYFVSIGTTNNFTDTNFTSSRKIGFSNENSWFNYNNQTTGNIWLKTNVSAATNITRTLANWSQTNMSWTESASTGITANYTLTGLMTSAVYTVYSIFGSNRILNYTQSTDANGVLIFNMSLNTTTRRIMVIRTNPFEISNCAELNQAGATYNLTTNFNNFTIPAGRACINITANNIVFDCRGYNVNGTGINNYGIYIYRASAINTNITVKNCVVTNWYTGINLQNANNNTLTNNTASRNSNCGVYLVSSSNNILTNNTVKSNIDWGIYLSSSSNNNIITGGSIHDHLTRSDYYFYSAGTNNNFTDTNFTSSRIIQFFGTSDQFNYNNQTTGNIWLKTNVSAGATYITRNLVSWSQTNMSWNEVASASVRANYILTELLPSKIYTVYSIFGSNYILNYTKSTDANGVLIFNMSLNTTARTIMVNTTVSAVDTTPPTFSNYNANTTAAGAPVNFSIIISDETGLSGYIFETNNTGRWVNYTWTSLLSGWTAYNMTRLNSTVGAVVNVSFYANDTSNNWGVYRTSLTTADVTLPYFSANATNTTIAGKPANFTISVTDDASLDSTAGYIFSTNNSGTWTNSSYRTFADIGFTLTAWNVTTLNSTVGALVQWRFYANDTSNNWNKSAMYNLTTTTSAGDTTPPTFSSNATSTTVAGQPANFTISVTDNVNLGSAAGYIFESNNSGTWRNASYRTFADTGFTLTAWNVTTLNSSIGARVQWRFYANDTSNNWNKSAIYNLTTTAVPTGCEGYVKLSIGPTFAPPSSYVEPSAYGLSNCNGNPVYFNLSYSGCYSGTRVSSCIASDSGCTGYGFLVPSVSDSYEYFACVDKNNDGDFGEPGEQASLFYTVGYSSLPEFGWMGIVQIMILASVIILLIRKKS